MTDDDDDAVTSRETHLTRNEKCFILKRQDERIVPMNSIK